MGSIRKGIVRRGITDKYAFYRGDMLGKRDISDSD